MNIYVGNIDTKWQDADLKNLFATHGEVSSAIVAIDSFTGTSRGFGYVDMPSEEEGKAAIAALNKTTVNGQELSIREADPEVIRKGSYKVGNGAVNVYRFRKDK